MTFQEIIGWSKKKYHTSNEVVIFDILYSLSNLVKDKLTFTQLRTNQIDFNKQTFYKLLEQYFTKSKPLGSITKKTQFYGLNIEIFTKIFNPRTETEFLCQKVIEILTKDKTLKNGLDLCCGTGAIALAIKNNCPWIKILGVDINKIAIENTKVNAKINNLEIKTAVGDFYKTAIKHKSDFIICNPPYVDMRSLDRKMTQYESKISFNNGDTLFFYEQIINNYKRLLKSPNKFLIGFEIGYDLKKQLIKLLKKNNLLKYSKFYKDYSNFDRVLIIKK